MKTKKITYYILAIFGVLIGLYPLIYFIVPNREFGLLASKTTALLADPLWNVMFYIHILLGGVALLIGWIQFNKKLRLRHIKLHKKIGKTYVISVFLSAISGLYIGYFATGGSIAQSGFISMAIFWFFSTLFAFSEIKKGNIIKHQKLMIYSYAACFSAVTLRIWLPILSATLGGFLPAYRIVAWLSWIPNIIIAHFIIKHQFKNQQFKTL